MPQPSSQLSPQAVTGAAGVAVLDRDFGVVTTEALTTAAGAVLTYTVFSKEIKAPGEGSQSGTLPFVTISNGTNSQGDPSLQTVAVAQGKITIKVVNRDAVNPFNGSLKFAIGLWN
jgi:hypothetical protein